MCDSKQNPVTGHAIANTYQGHSQLVVWAQQGVPSGTAVVCTDAFTWFKLSTGATAMNLKISAPSLPL